MHFSWDFLKNPLTDKQKACIIIPMTITITLQERVNRGAELLDREYPGWVDRINLNTLDTASGRLCPLSQAAGQEFNEARRTLDLTTKDAAFAGLTVDRELDGNSDEWNSVFRYMTALWKEKILQRRQDVQPASVPDTLNLPFPLTSHSAVFVLDNALATLTASIREDLLAGKADPQKVEERQKMEEALRILSA